MAKSITEIRSAARVHTETALRVLAAIAAKGESESARVTACGILLDRGWGKPPQTHVGENGEGDIRITIRHILEGSNGNSARVVDHKATPRVASHDVTTPDGGETAG